MSLPTRSKRGRGSIIVIKNKIKFSEINMFLNKHKISVVEIQKYLNKKSFNLNKKNQSSLNVKDLGALPRALL